MTVPEKREALMPLPELVPTAEEPGSEEKQKKMALVLR